MGDREGGTEDAMNRDDIPVFAKRPPTPREILLEQNLYSLWEIESEMWLS